MIKATVNKCKHTYDKATNTLLQKRHNPDSQGYQILLIWKSNTNLLNRDDIQIWYTPNDNLIAPFDIKETKSSLTTQEMSSSARQEIHFQQNSSILTLAKLAKSQTFSRLI